jgi:CheY-like chemotaxis protein
LADDALMAVVLIVEDEVFIRMVAEMTIESLGHCTLVAGNVAQALAHLAGPDRIDAMFVDLRLQNDRSGGFEVARHAVNIRPDMRVLYTSGTNLTSEMELLFVHGGQFLLKPYSPEHLIFAFERLFI